MLPSLEQLAQTHPTLLQMGIWVAASVPVTAAISSYVRHRCDRNVNKYMHELYRTITKEHPELELPLKPTTDAETLRFMLLQDDPSLMSPEERAHNVRIFNEYISDAGPFKESSTEINLIRDTLNQLVDRYNACVER